MFRFPLLALLCGTGILTLTAAQPVWVETFDTPSNACPPELLEQVPGRGGVLHIVIPPGTSRPNRAVNLSIPVEKCRAKRVFLGADVKIANVSRRPNQWNGVKVMAVIESTSGKSYPQPDIPDGTADWQRYATWVAVPQNATNIVLVLGLENVTGEAWFDNVSIVPRSEFRSSLKVDPTSPIFRGHNLPRLRGAMAGTDLQEQDVKYFATEWKGNLLRLQLFEAARQDRSLEAYDIWLEERLRHIDQMLSWCEKYAVMAVLDLHSPPGGQAFAAGYITARGHIFTQPEAQSKFIQVWEKMTARYKGRKIIWGFDLVNEPDDSMLSEACLDWNSLADKAARAIRAVDPDRTLIVEPDKWGGPQGFASFQPLDLPGIVYSFHFYQPMKFTHQGIQQNAAGIYYPGNIDNELWNKDRLLRAMQPALDFAQKYRVHMYVGEFSAIRTAPDDSAAKYLADVISIFESHGFDWSYHAYREWQGWSLEHEGPLDQPVLALVPTARQKAVTDWFGRNVRPVF